MKEISQQVHAIIQTHYDIECTKSHQGIESKICNFDIFLIKYTHMTKCLLCRFFREFDQVRKIFVGTIS